MFKKFALFSDSGLPLAFFSEDIHGERNLDEDVGGICLIPKEAVEITNEQWEEFTLNQGKRYWDDGRVSELALENHEEFYPSLTSRQFWLAALEVGITKEGLLLDLQSAFSGLELEYYKIEVSEASSFKRDNPLIDILANINGFTPAQIDDLWLRAASI